MANANGREEISSISNLELAWKRIQTSSNYQYKKLNEEIYVAFSWNLENNLNLLSSEIKEKIYKPSKSSKYYLPKSTDLVRPITCLSIKDQIYYQAIVNLICLNKLDIIRQFRGKSIFGGFNIKDPSSIFLLERWKYEYRLYKNTIKETFVDGYKWMVRFDLASFYDLIDHKILVEVSSYGALDEEIENEFCEALKVWSQPQAIDFYHSHGIPQGPCASQVLADIYLHILDRKILGMAPKYNLKYFRYVDDIVILGKTDKDVRIGLIQLDIAARELSLIPQSKKIVV